MLEDYEELEKIFERRRQNQARRKFYIFVFSINIIIFNAALLYFDMIPQFSWLNERYVYFFMGLFSGLLYLFFVYLYRIFDVQNEELDRIMAERIKNQYKRKSSRDITKILDNVTELDIPAEVQPKTKR